MITFDENRVIGNRFLVYSVPYSKNTNFGIEDLYELASLLKHTNDVGVGISSDGTYSYSENDFYQNKVSLLNDPIEKHSITSSESNHANRHVRSNRNDFQYEAELMQSDTPLEFNQSSNSITTNCPKRQFIRLPKFMSMFASRACRSAIMIGTALRMNDMKNIVKNLGTLHQPWNCPHGRPTLRHLFDLASTTESKTD